METGKIYHCTGCGAVVELLRYGAGLRCCGHEMELLVAQTEGEKAPTHKPVVESVNDGVKVKVGSVPHAMDPDHYISWIEIEKDGVISRKFLKPGDNPSATFSVSGDVTTREYCTTHGFWESTM